MILRSYIPPAWYATSDFVAGFLSWLLFEFIRKDLLNETVPFLQRPHFWLSAFAISLGWLALFTLMGSYHSIYKKSRAGEFTSTFFGTLLGTIVLFFLLLVNDVYNFHYEYYYKAFAALWLLQFLFTFGGRLILLETAKQQINQRIIRFPAMVIGPSQNAIRLLHHYAPQLALEGFEMQGYLETSAQEKTNGAAKYLGSLQDLENVLDKNKIQLVVLAVPKSDETGIAHIVERIGEKDVELRMEAGIIDILTGSVQSRNVLGAPLIELRTEPMPQWQQNTKRLLDVMLSIVGMLLLLPLLPYIALRVRLSSRGPIFFRQERVGYKGRPFTLYKFRSMQQDAEVTGPALSSDNDPRITPWGRVMRKWRLDELPQLWNVLRGDMSLVGPRPERRFYINQVVERFPYYKYLLKVKPGLTSWGIVQFGYAENVEEMIERSRFDLLYVEKASLLLDLKIMIHTLRIIFLGKGK